jgi:two-component system, NarL family, response regulator LiaR
MDEKQRIKVLIADDHDMVRKGLIVLLDNFGDIIVVGEANNGQAAIDLCARVQPDVILMDLSMPRIDGVNAIPAIRERLPDTQVIILTSYYDEESVQSALKAGAVGYLLKNISGNELADAIRKAYKGQSTLAPEATQVLIRATTRPPALGRDLTEREREVLSLMLSGASNREIGEQLVISSSTVKNHVSSILSKLGTTSRTHAVALALEHGLVART